MKTFVSVSLVALVLGLALVWWGRADAPSEVAGSGPARVEAVRRDAVNPAAVAMGDRGTVGRSPAAPSWIPSDAERVDDRGAFLTWTPTDAERVDDPGTSRTWIPSDAEREDDQGAYLTWTARDAERDDDVGVPMRGAAHRL